MRNPTVRVHGVDIGEEFIIAGRSEFSGCSLCMMGGCVCQKMVYVPQGQGLGGGLLPSQKREFGGCLLSPFRWLIHPFNRQLFGPNPVV